MDDVRQLFRRKLKHLRHSREMSQEELSRECEYSHAYVGEIERGEQDPSFEALRRLAGALDVSVVEFFVRPGEETLAENLERSIETVTEDEQVQLRSRELLESMIDNPYRMMGLWDSRGRILDFNCPVDEIVHGDALELLGREAWRSRIFDLEEEYREWIRDRLRKLEESPGVYRRTMTLLSGDQERIDTEVSMSPIKRRGEDRYVVLAEAHRTEDLRDG